MAADRDDIRDAVACATVAKGDLIRHRAYPNDDEIAATRRTVIRFLENVPDDITALELRESLDEGSTDD